jgi:hypothetical protein
MNGTAVDLEISYIADDMRCSGNEPGRYGRRRGGESRGGGGEGGSRAERGRERETGQAERARQASKAGWQRMEESTRQNIDRQKSKAGARQQRACKGAWHGQKQPRVAARAKEETA